MFGSQGAGEAEPEGEGGTGREQLVLTVRAEMTLGELKAQIEVRVIFGAALTPCRPPATPTAAC